VQEIRGVTEVIERVSDISTVITSAVEEQGAATREIARNVHEAAMGVQEVSRNITGVHSAADRGGQASRTLLGNAQTLALHADTLNSEVASFLQRVKTS
jgi:methyl-accepting chemotaxis protein